MTFRTIQGLLSVWMICQSIAAYGYSSASHRESDEIFSKGVIKSQEYQQLLENMNALDAKLNSPSGDLRGKIIDLYARLSHLRDETNAQKINDTRGEGLLRRLESYMIKYILKNPASNNTMAELKKEAQEVKGKLISSEQGSKNHTPNGKKSLIAGNNKS